MVRPSSFSIADYRDKNRLLFILAPSSRSPAYEEQVELLEDERAQCEARDLIIGTVLEEGTSRVGDRKLDADAVRRLRDRLAVAEDEFAVILLGKDGEVKRRDDTPVKPEVLYRLIDEELAVNS